MQNKDKNTIGREKTQSRSTEAHSCMQGPDTGWQKTIRYTTGHSYKGVVSHSFCFGLYSVVT